MSARPTAREERQLSLREELRSLIGSRFLTREMWDRVAPVLAGPWHPSRSWFIRILFFGLTCLGVSSLTGFVGLVTLGSFKLASLIGGVLALVAGEVVLRKFHPWRSGVEESLWLCGLVAVIVSLPSEGKPEALLVFALAGTIVAIRCLSSGFMSIAVLLVIVYAGVKAGNGGHSYFAFSGTAAAWASAGVFVIAAFAVLQPIRRPWIERTLSTLVVVLPIAAYVFALLDSTGDTLSWIWIGMFLAVAVLATALAVVRRVRSFFYAGALCTVVVGVELARQIDIPLSGRCIVGGIVVLAAALVLERWLRTSRNGFTSDEIGSSEVMNVLQIAGASALQAAAAPATPGPAGGPPPLGGGGSFGGAGATGDY